MFDVQDVLFLLIFVIYRLQYLLSIVIYLQWGQLYRSIQNYIIDNTRAILDIFLWFIIQITVCCDINKEITHLNFLYITQGI